MKDPKNMNYYELLGVKRHAPGSEIKKAFKEIALVYHPDSHFFDDILQDAGVSGSALGIDQVEMFKLVTAAYDTLIRPDKRRAYDQTLPPDLDSWDTEGLGVDFHSQLLARRANSEAPRAFGTFGRPAPVEELQEAAGEPESEDTSTWRHLKGLFGKR